MTEVSLWVFANGFAFRSERAGRGTKWPTLRECADHFGTTMRAVEELADAADLLDLLVGFGTYDGGADLPRREWQVEALQ